MSNPVIHVEMGDIGGKNAGEPPLKLAYGAGCEIRVRLSAECNKRHKSGTLNLDPRFKIVTEVSIDSNLLVICASQSEKGSDSAFSAVCESEIDSSIIAIQDYYGSLAPTLTKLDKARFSDVIATICVTDEFAHDHLLDLSPVDNKPLSESMVVTGGPQYDNVATAKKTWVEDRVRIRRELCDKGVLKTKDDTLFLIAGQLNGTAESLSLVFRGHPPDTSWSAICRLHPRRTAVDDDIMWQYSSEKPSFWIDHGQGRSRLANTTEELLPAVDFVLSGYSTTNYYSILYQMPGVVYVGTPGYLWDLFQEKGLQKPIEAELGAAWYVTNFYDMAHVIEEVRKGDQSKELHEIQAVQAKIAAQNDGHAAERVWAEMQKLL